MQEVFEDGSLGELHIADTLEELLPLIKKSLANPRVKYIMVSNAADGKKVQANEHKKETKDLLEYLEEG